jgi:hypothetical protein
VVEDKEIYEAFIEWLNYARTGERIQIPLKKLISKLPEEKPTFTRYDAIKERSKKWKK